MPDRLVKAATFAAAHAAKGIHVGDMAAVAGMSNPYFIRRFKREMGVTPARYLTVARLKIAQLMLAHTTIPLAEVAVECGFSNQSSMTTAFKREYSMTPGQYRKRYSGPRPDDSFKLPVCERCPLREMLEWRSSRLS